MMTNVRVKAIYKNDIAICKEAKCLFPIDTVYTIFAICEYCIVFSNIAFHGVFTVDMGHGSLEFVTPSAKMA